MRIQRVLYFLIFLSIFNLNSGRSYGQDINQLMIHPWVNSSFDELSVTDRINQLLVLNIDEENLTANEMPQTFGGAMVASEGPDAYRRIVSEIQENVSIPALIISKLKEDYYGINLDSLNGFGTAMTLAAIGEPYLLYETGTMLASQSHWLGINALISSGRDLLRRDIFRNEWRLLEINQGLIDQQVLPLNYLELVDFEKINPEDLIRENVLIRISPENIDKFHKFVRELIAAEKLTMQELNLKCRQILALKIFAFSNNSIEGTSELSKEEIQDNAESLRFNLFTQAITVLKNESNRVPMMHLEHTKIASLTIGKTNNRLFESYLDNYAEVDHFQVDYDAEDSVFANLWTDLNSYDVIICAIYETEFLKSGIERIEGFSIFGEWLNRSGKCISIYFGNPSLLESNRILADNDTFIIAFEDNDENNELVPQLIFGGIGAYGKLPANISYRFMKNEGELLGDLGRFSYAKAESAGLDSKRLQKIDSIVQDAIRSKAMPGCQVLVAKDSKVVYQKAFGYHTYDSIRKVSNSDLYDLASITKVSGALPALMKLYEEGKFDLEATMGTYLPYFKKGNKKRLTYREILAHQSGLTPYIVYWKTAIRNNGRYRRKTLSNEPSDVYPYELSPGLYLHEAYKDKIYKQIKKSKLGEKKYSYSGLTFLLYPEIIETISGQDYETYLHENFYDPLGASSITYNPLKKFSLDNIVPTEYDSLFRKEQIHGTVHDEAAAMLNGVSSNAGLFANANDLAKLFQMYCNYGTFGNKEYLSEETLLEFTRCQYPENDNRRALGFDRPLPEPNDNGNTAKSVSQSSFGHSGFTGTFAWVDPEYNLVYIFLSNRVYQTRANTKLYTMNVRTNIQEVIYEAMKTVE